MVAKSEIAPLIVVVGQTASGKSELAMELAKRFNGEIISADSRTLYRGMDIGTAKPSKQDRCLIKHHLIDITTPDKPLNVADFKDLALKTIDQVGREGKLPILVGGSGLYIDSVLFDFQFNAAHNATLREELNRSSVADLQARIIKEGLDMPYNEKNKRHLIRRLETGRIPQQNTKLRNNTLIIGIKVDREELKKNVELRLKSMMSQGLLNEVSGLAEQYGWETESLRTIGYREFRPYVLGEQDLATTEEDIKRETMRYAKRQETWFKRNKDIHWVEKQIQAVDLVTTFLNK